MVTLADAGSHCTNLWCDYLATQFDPAHLLSELGFTIIFDLILVWLVWGKMIKPYLDKRVNQMHVEIDAEHHLEHHDHEEAEPVISEWHYDHDMVLRKKE